MYWNWKDLAVDVAFSVKPSWFNYSTEYHKAFLKNGSNKKIADFRISYVGYNWRGQVVDKNGFISFSNVDPGETHREEIILETKTKINSAILKFADGKEITIDPKSISRKTSPIEVFRFTPPRFLIGFVALMAATFLLRGCTKSGQIEDCLLKRSGYSTDAFISDDWVTVRYGGTPLYSGEKKSFYNISIYTREPGYMSVISKGTSYPSILYLKGMSPDYVVEDKWNDPGEAEPQRTHILDIKACTMQVLPERSAALK